MSLCLQNEFHDLFPYKSLGKATKFHLNCANISKVINKKSRGGTLYPHPSLPRSNKVKVITHSSPVCLALVMGHSSPV